MTLPAHAQSVTYVNSFGSAGNGAGQFDIPGFITRDSSGLIYVSDTGNSRIEYYTPSGPGLYLGQITGLNSPYGVAVNNTTGNIYVAEPYDIKIYNSAGTFQTTWTPTFDTSVDSGLVGMAINQTTGDVYVVDSGGTAGGYVLRYSSTGTLLGSYGTTGSAPGQFYGAFGIAINQATGQFYVTESGFSSDNSQHTARVMRFSSTGDYELEWGSSGTGTDQFSFPYGIAVDHNGAIYVVSLSGNRVSIFDADGNYLTRFGSSGTGALNSPRGIVVDDDGYIFVSDSNNNRVSVWLGADLVYTPPMATTSDLPPTVAAKGKKRIVTFKGSYKLKGTAGDPDGNLARVEVQVGKKHFKPARGTTSWKFVVHLKVGTNLVTIRAVDANGKTSVLAKKKIKRLAPPAA